MTNSAPPSAFPAFDVVAFEQLRRSQRLGFGHPLTVLESIGSTNDQAKRAARHGAASGSLFLAEHQTEGRGRRQRRWVSAPGENLLFSVVLRPDISPRRVSAFALVVGLAVRAAVAACGAGSASIKWPNDVLVGRRKLAGILLESQLQAGRLSALVVGVGINVNATRFEGELADAAISLRILVGTAVAREPVLAAVLGALEGLTGAYERGGLESILPELERYDALRGEAISVDGVRGIGAGIDGEGALLLDREGNLSRVHSGSVSWTG